MKLRNRKKPDQKFRMEIESIPPESIVFLVGIFLCTALCLASIMIWLYFLANAKDNQKTLTAAFWSNVILFLFNIVRVFWLGFPDSFWKNYGIILTLNTIAHFLALLLVKAPIPCSTGSDVVSIFCSFMLRALLSALLAVWPSAVMAGGMKILCWLFGDE